MNFEFNTDQKELLRLCKEFTLKEIIPVAAQYDSSQEYPTEIIKKAHQIGLMNLTIPSDVGGTQAQLVEQCIVHEHLAYGCSGIMTAISGNELALGPIAQYGNKNQWEEFLAPMLEKPLMASYCVTEPCAGSDVQGISSKVQKVKGGYILNGEKIWITNAGHASWFYLLAKLHHENLPHQITSFILPSNLKGITLGKKEHNLGQRCSDTRGISFENVFIDQRYLLGKEGDGFLISMHAFDHSRPLIAAMAVGVAQRCLDLSIKYATERKSFGKPIIKHQQIQVMLANMSIRTQAARLLTYQAAFTKDQGQRNTLIASQAKAFAGDAAVQNATEAIQVYGGYGYNQEYPVEKLYRDAKIFQIYEGTQQIQRMIIARELEKQISV